VLRSHAFFLCACETLDAILFAGFRVFGVLHCSSGKSSDRVQLDNCVDRLHAFESGRVDAFELVRPSSAFIGLFFFHI